MGASQSVISTEDFKNYLYGTAVLMLAPRLDTAVQFKECSQITDEDKHVLPMVLDQAQPKDLDSIIKAYCQYYGNSGKEDAIDKYVQDHILDSEEHIDVFMKRLVSLLQEHRGGVEANIQRLGPEQHHSVRAPAHSHRSQVRAPAPSVQSQHVQDPAQKEPVPAHSVYSVKTPTPSTHRIRGHGRLQRRIQNVNQAIDNEQSKQPSPQPVQQPQPQPQPQPPQDQELIASTSQNMALAYRPVEQEDIQNLEEYVNENEPKTDVYDEVSTVSVGQVDQ